MGAQITLHERYAISILKQRGLSIRAIARELSRSPSTISRELSRNRTRHDGCYRYELADSYCRTRRSRSRRGRSRATGRSTRSWATPTGRTAR